MHSRRRTYRERHQADAIADRTTGRTYGDRNQWVRQRMRLRQRTCMPQDGPPPLAITTCFHRLRKETPNWGRPPFCEQRQAGRTQCIRTWKPRSSQKAACSHLIPTGADHLESDGGIVPLVAKLSYISIAFRHFSIHICPVTGWQESCFRFRSGLMFG
jgi:hypothetical protein